MPEPLAEALVLLAGVHLLAGVLLLPWWYWRGIRKLDAGAASATWGARLLWAPGLVLLWPFLIRRGWQGNGHPPPEENPHRRAARARPAP
jgi:hypothetical protein